MRRRGAALVLGKRPREMDNSLLATHTYMYTGARSSFLSIWDSASTRIIQTQPWIGMCCQYALIGDTAISVIREGNRPGMLRCNVCKVKKHAYGRYAQSLSSTLKSRSPFRVELRL